MDLEIIYSAEEDEYDEANKDTNYPGILYVFICLLVYLKKPWKHKLLNDVSEWHKYMDGLVSFLLNDRINNLLQVVI